MREHRKPVGPLLRNLAEAPESNCDRRKGGEPLAGHFSRVNGSCNLPKRAHRKEIAGRVRFFAQRAVTVVLGGHHECERVASNPKRASLVAKEKAPSAERLRETIFVARVNDGTGTRNHDDARRSGQRARMRHRSIVHQNKTLRSHLRHRTVDASFVAAHARRDRCKLTLIWEIRVAARICERAVQGVAQPRRTRARAYLVGRPRRAAPENPSILVANHRSRRTLSAVYSCEQIAQARASRNCAA